MNSRRAEMIRTKIPTAARKRTVVGALRFNADMYAMPPHKTMNDLLDEHRLSQHLKRVVMREYAPQSLLDAIQKGIRT